MARTHSRTRRVLLIGSALVGGGLVIGGALAWRRLSQATAFRPKVTAGEHALTPWFKLSTDNQLIVQVPRQDMGQGVASMLAMIVAEELDFDWSRVRFEQAAVAPIYANTVVLADGSPPALKSMMQNMARLIGVQMTGGSTSVRDAWGGMRQAAAAARQVLLTAAAQSWSVPVSELAIEQGIVRHAASQKQAPLASFAAAAAALPLPKEAPPKPVSAWTLLGKSPPRLDVPEKTLGQARFGIDMRPEGLLYAAVKHIPLVRGELQEVRWKQGKPPASVLHEVRGSDWLAVIARSWWEAERALEQAELIAGGASARLISDAAILKQYQAVLEGEDDPARLPDLGKPLRRVFGESGSIERALREAPAERRFSRDYSVPFQAHMTMEPLNCTARIKDGEVDVWVGNQAPTIVQWLASGMTGIPSDKVRVHTPYLGGGFGRRFDLEVIRQALACAKLTKGRPVQLIWSRREDIQHDAYRPPVMARMSAVFDASGAVAGWNHAMVGPSVSKSVLGRMNPMLAGNYPPDLTNAEGAMHLPYGFTHFRCQHAQVELPVPLGYWRSVGNSYNAFFVETFLDEIAQHLRRDPYLLRMQLLKDSPRHARVLEAAVSAARWASALPGPGWGRGLALAESFKSIVAMVVEVEVIGTTIQVRRITSAVDCGTALDPRNVKAQIASAAIFGLTAALKPTVTLKDGAVQESNFHELPLLRLNECPVFETVIIDSGAPLGGVGEIGVPPLAPALGNAIFAATGKRLREMPFKLPA